MVPVYICDSRKGQLLRAAAAGVIPAGIRIFNVHPEGVCFRIHTASCLANALSLVKKRHVYGARKA